MLLKIFLHNDGMPLIQALQSLPASWQDYKIHLYCQAACSDDESRITDFCMKMKSKIGVDNFRLFSSSPSFSLLANELFLNEKPEKEALILFASGAVLFDWQTLHRMAEKLVAREDLAGVNPALLNGWSDSNQIAFMGITVDLQKRFHYIYEGLNADSPLAKKERCFQLAYPGCLLIRESDFIRAGGFDRIEEDLVFISLCSKIRDFRTGGFLVLPETSCRLLDRFSSWKFCGLWNSLLQTDRIESNLFKADYPHFCESDNLGYICDSWLNEGPQNEPDFSGGALQEPWLAWRSHPSPFSLINYLISLPMELRAMAISLARQLPASLPKTLKYYQVLADRLAKDARQENLSDLYEFLEKWQKNFRQFHYGQLKRGMRLLVDAGIYNCALDYCPAIYDGWIELKEHFEALNEGADWPEISVVMPVWNPNANFLKQAIQSVQGQTYNRWELCIADDASTKGDVKQILESFAREDKRIRIKYREQNGHICAATNSALSLVNTSWSAFMDHDDLLSPHALAEVARLIAGNKNLKFIFSDEDHINVNNIRRNPVFKPDFDIDLLYIGHLSVYSTSLLREVGGLRPGVEGSQDQDLWLRVGEMLTPGEICHIPQVLYHWRVHEESTAGTLLSKPYVLEATIKSLCDAARRKGHSARALETARKNAYKLLYDLPAGTSCTVILLLSETPPSAKLLDILKQLSDIVDLDIIFLPVYPDFIRPEINFAHAEVLSCIGMSLPQCFNVGAKAITGDVGLFLDSGLEPALDCRPEQLIFLALRGDVAMAGSNIWTEERLHNGGWYPDVDGRLFPLLQGARREDIVKLCWGHFLLSRHVIAPAWECVAISKRNFADKIFLDESLGPLALMDYCLRQTVRGKVVTITPWGDWSFPAKSMTPHYEEQERFTRKWGSFIRNNGVRNPNLKAAPDRDWTLIL